MNSTIEAAVLTFWGQSWDKPKPPIMKTVIPQSDGLDESTHSAETNKDHWMKKGWWVLPM